ncbi:MAG TPA: helicase associated domain-containing protein, partial [Aliarcobacter cryaerophilus]|nr:helicase associated domain-containing protein [Aliarcobacter cryaerophilus]
EALSLFYSEEGINRLNEVGLIWNPIESLWDKNFTELCRFKGINGHCNVPQNYPENSSLAGWVCSNRNLYQKKSKQEDLKREKKIL